MQEQVKSQVLQFYEVEAARFVAKVDQVAEESNVQSLAASKSALPSKGPVFARRVGKLGNKVSEMRHDSDHKVDDVLF